MAVFGAAVANAITGALAWERSVSTLPLSPAPICSMSTFFFLFLLLALRPLGPRRRKRQRPSNLFSTALNHGITLLCVI